MEISRHQKGYGMLEVALVLMVTVSLFLAIVDIFILLRARSVLQREATILSENSNLLTTASFPSTQRKIISYLQKVITIDGISCRSTQAPQQCCSHDSPNCLTVEVIPNQGVLDRANSQNLTVASIILTYNCSLWILDKWTNWTSNSTVSHKVIPPIIIEKRIKQANNESAMPPPVIESYRGVSPNAP
jgi:hypothetical protein